MNSSPPRQPTPCHEEPIDSPSLHEANGATNTLLDYPSIHDPWEEGWWRRNRPISMVGAQAECPDRGRTRCRDSRADIWNPAAQPAKNPVTPEPAAIVDTWPSKEATFN